MSIFLLNGIYPENLDSERLEILRKVSWVSWLEDSIGPMDGPIMVPKAPKMPERLNARKNGNSIFSPEQ